eukprot:TRINITY_DN25381_c0_g1_i4.p1 TRINITY_DN25381_c0_g1~~TRINITY_DN25381_c0_g1_i4.p1  ORF type:complete len:327 (+),score=78.65 TRINITY_DN25381_c0_g1_i4:43-1023(+)
MITLTRFMHGDDSQDILDALTEHQPHIWMFLWTFTAISSFVLLNLVTAVIVQQAFDMTKGDEAEMARELQAQQAAQMAEFRGMFEELDADESGQVNREEFQQAFEIPKIKNQLTILGLKEKELMQLFELLDTDGEGQLDLEEFMEGMSDLQGVAKSKDMVMLVKGIERIEKTIRQMSCRAHGVGAGDDDHGGGGDGNEGAGGAVAAVGARVPGRESSSDVSLRPHRREVLRKRFYDLRSRLNRRLQDSETEVQALTEYLLRLRDEAEEIAKNVSSAGRSSSTRNVRSSKLKAAVTTTAATKTAATAVTASTTGTIPKQTKTTSHEQ